MTFEVILYFMEICIFIMLSFIKNSSQNQFINECARKNLAKIPEGRKDFLLGEGEELKFLIKNSSFT